MTTFLIKASTLVDACVSMTPLVERYDPEKDSARQYADVRVTDKGHMLMTAGRLDHGAMQRASIDEWDGDLEHFSLTRAQLVLIATAFKSSWHDLRITTTAHVTREADEMHPEVRRHTVRISEDATLFGGDTLKIQADQQDAKQLPEIWAEVRRGANLVPNGLPVTDLEADALKDFAPAAKAQKRIPRVVQGRVLRPVLFVHIGSGFLGWTATAFEHAEDIEDVRASWAGDIPQVEIPTPEPRASVVVHFPHA